MTIGPSVFNSLVKHTQRSILLCDKVQANVELDLRGWVVRGVRGGVRSSKGGWVRVVRTVGLDMLYLICVHRQIVSITCHL